MAKALFDRHCWIFDLDGTLTQPIHNFEQIRKTIGIPGNTPILEYIRTLPTKTAADVDGKLQDIELELAHQAKAEVDAVEFLNQLSLLKYRLGVVTRNTAKIARLTLKTAGLLKYFSNECIFGRDNAIPKPSPAGIQRLLTLWNESPDNTVMVGDYLFDLQAGKAAGTKTVYLDRKGLSAWTELADISVSNFNELVSKYCSRTIKHLLKQST